jgi:hypothetical protein
MSASVGVHFQSHYAPRLKTARVARSPGTVQVEENCDRGSGDEGQVIQTEGGMKIKHLVGVLAYIAFRLGAYS